MEGTLPANMDRVQLGQQLVLPLGSPVGAASEHKLASGKECAPQQWIEPRAMQPNKSTHSMYWTRTGASGQEYSNLVSGRMPE